MNMNEQYMEEMAINQDSITTYEDWLDRVIKYDDDDWETKRIRALIDRNHFKEQNSAPTKDQLRKEFYKVMGETEPFGNEFHNELFEYHYSKLSEKDEEIDRLKNELKFQASEVSDRELKIKRLESHIKYLKDECDRLKKELEIVKSGPNKETVEMKSKTDNLI